MATTTKTQYPFEAPFDQFKGTSDQVLAAARKAGGVYIDSYEQAVDRALEIESHLDLSRELTSAYANTARTALK